MRALKKRNVNYPTLAQPARVGTRRKKPEAEPKDCPTRRARSPQNDNLDSSAVGSGRLPVQQQEANGSGSVSGKRCQLNRTDEALLPFSGDVTNQVRGGILAAQRRRDILRASHAGKHGFSASKG